MTTAKASRVAKGSAQKLTLGLGTKFVTAVRSVRGRHLLLIDYFAILLSIYAALSLRLDGLLGLELLAPYLPIALLPLAVRPLVNVRFGLYRRSWRYASVPDLTQIVWAVAAGTAICVILFVGALVLGFQEAHSFPKSFWILEMILTLALFGGLRFFVRACNEIGTWAVIEGEPVVLTPALLFGAGQTGALMARSARREPKAGVIPVGFLDNDPARRGSSVAGLRIYGGLDQLDEAVRRTGARTLLITMPNASGESVRKIMDARGRGRPDRPHRPADLRAARRQPQRQPARARSASRTCSRASR